jgi:hypothetical protein
MECSDVIKTYFILLTRLEYHWTTDGEKTLLKQTRFSHFPKGENEARFILRNAVAYFSVIRQAMFKISAKFCDNLI